VYKQPSVAEQKQLLVLCWDAVACAAVLMLIAVIPSVNTVVLLLTNLQNQRVRWLLLLLLLDHAATITAAACVSQVGLQGR
jgi:hypothetical protein